MIATINPSDIVGSQPFAPIPTCVSVATILTDSEKLLLGRLYQYAGGDGEAYPYRKTLAVDLGWTLEKLKRNISSLKTKGFLHTVKKTQNAPRVFLFLEHELYHTPINETREQTREANGRVKNKPTGRVKNDLTSYENIIYKTKEVAKATSAKPDGLGSAVEKDESKVISKLMTKPLKNHTIDLINHWNSLDPLRTHKLEGKRTIAPRNKQSKTIQRIDSVLTRLLNGTYYSSKSDLPDRLRKKKFTVDEIKIVMDRIALLQTSEYSHKPKRVGLLDVIENPYAPLSRLNSDKYRFKFPLLHWCFNEPVRIDAQQAHKNTDYGELVKKVINRLNDHSVKGTKYNRVVTQVEKAVGVVNQKANGNRNDIMCRLPDLIYDSLVDIGKGITVEALPLGVWNLESMMRERNII